MYKVILVRQKTKTHKADLVEDYVRMQQFALEKKREEAIDKWLKEKIFETYIKLNSDYKECNFKRNWKGENQSTDTLHLQNKTGLSAQMVNDKSAYRKFDGGMPPFDTN